MVATALLLNVNAIPMPSNGIRGSGNVNMVKVEGKQTVTNMNDVSTLMRQIFKILTKIGYVKTI